MFISMMEMGLLSPFLLIYADTLGASKLEVGMVRAPFNITGIGTLLFAWMVRSSSANPASMGA